MPKYRKKAAKKTPYEGQGTIESTAAKDKTQTPTNSQKPQVDTSKDKAWAPSTSQQTQTETSTCDKCERHTEHLIQYEFCALWFCDVCSSISEEFLNIVGDIQSLHWFCSHVMLLFQILL